VTQKQQFVKSKDQRKYVKAAAELITEVMTLRQLPGARSDDRLIGRQTSSYSAVS
jgi:hypothetical protein